MSVTINDKYAKPGGGLKGKIPFKSSTGQRYGHIPEAVYNILNKYGSDAHLYTFGPGVPILGPELITNGDFSNWMTGWDGFATSVVGGEAVITADGVGSYVGPTQTVQCAPGKRYELSVTGRRGTTAGDANIYVAFQNGGSAVFAGTVNSTTSNATVKFQFTASGDGVLTVTPHIGGSPSPAGTAYFDNITVREILGYSNTYSGFVAGNYFDSAGTTHASVDGSVGLVLDGAGSVGAELLTPFDATWGKTGAATALAGVGVVTPNDQLYKYGSTVAGKKYILSWTATTSTGSGAVYEASGTNTLLGSLGVVGLNRVIFTAQVNGGGVQFASFGGTATLTDILLKEVTGIHATQSTPGYKPTLRKGIVNLLTWSNDLTNAAWAAGGGASKSGQVITLSNTYASNVQQSYSGVVGGTYTAAIALSGTPGATVAVRIIDLGGGYPATTQNVTLTATPTIYLVTRAGTTVAPLGVGVVDNGSATSVNFHGAALFQGTLTAAQILAAGGIPLTTTAPASSVAGVNYLEFDGDDSLTLSGPLFQMADDHCVVLAFTPQKLQAAFSAPSYSGNNRFGSIGTTSGGQYVVEWYDGTNYVPHATPCVLGETVVITAWKVEGNLIARKNGVQFGSSAAFSTSVQATTGAIGTGPLGASKGRIYANPVVKGTLALADVQLLEKQAAAAAGIQL